MLYSFDDYTLDAEHYELRQAGRLVRLEPQVFNVLAYLVQHPGRTVTKEELEEQYGPTASWWADPRWPTPWRRPAKPWRTRARCSDTSRPSIAGATASWRR